MPLFLLLACTSHSDSAATITDRREGLPPPPEGGLQLVSAELEIPPYTEQQYCLFGTYEGEDIGLHASEEFQAASGHHVVMLGTNFTTSEHPDGEMIDCTGENDIDMLRAEPLFIQGAYDDRYPSAASLPEGMAIKLAHGARYILQSHHINTTGTPILVQDAINLILTPAEEVDTWAATYAHSSINISIAPGESKTLTITCEFEEELSLLNLMGHMHEHGTAFSVDAVIDGASSQLYDVPDWLPEFRDDGDLILLDFGDEPLQVQPGDTFTTTCSWHNSTDHTLQFPEEMCATVGVAYPRESALTCLGF